MLVVRVSALLFSLALVGGIASAQTAPDAQNMTLVGHNNLGGASGGEGFAMRVAPRTTRYSVAGHRYLYAASEEFGDEVACFSVVDVENPAEPVVKEQIPISIGGANAGETPSGSADERKHVHCNSLDLAGNVLAVAQEVQKGGQPGAGILFYDVTDPGNPRLLSYFDTAGGVSHGTHHVWFADPTTLWAAGGAGTTHVPSDPSDPYAGQAYVPKRPDKDYMFAQVVDVRDPAHPRERTRWYYPGVASGDARPLPDAIPGADQGIRLHNVDVFPQRPNRAYLGFLDGGIVILDTTDPLHPATVSIFRYVGPGFTHTTYPVFARNLLEVSEEAFGPPPCADGPKRATVWSIADEKLPVLLGVAPFNDTTRFCPPVNSENNNGRYGSHNIWEGKPYGPSWHSDTLMLDTYFRGGVRVFDTSDPRSIKDVAHFIPAYDPSKDHFGTTQINDVYVDDRGLVYIDDRFGGGLTIVRSPLITCGPGQCHP
ncbi:MAG TPA: hypothetical protein VMD91_08355 [Candidatus Sulfotelmatobacter sp.]|nr:hypothetical protein [Candidatus Sulfotelmatobacter sp.]